MTFRQLQNDRIDGGTGMTSRLKLIWHLFSTLPHARILRIPQVCTVSNKLAQPIIISPGIVQMAIDDDTTSAKEAKQSADELSELSHQQSEALQAATYLGMTKEQADEYEKRAARISELCKLLGKFKAESPD